MIRSLLFTCLLSLSVIQLCKAQNMNVPYQFYKDANNNCIYDAGDTLIYNTQRQINLLYIDLFSTTNSVAAISNCGYSLTVTNPTVPASNSLTIQTGTAIGVPPISYNSSCSSYSNLSYSSTNYLPIQSISQYGSGSINNSVAPICFNIGNDTIYMDISFSNIYTCSLTTSSRTYSLYLDGILYDNITVTGAVGLNVGVGAKSKIYENYMNSADMISLRTTMPPSISAMGNHTLTVKSSLIFNHPLSKIIIDRKYNTVPCTKVSGRFYNDCNNNCIIDGGDGYINSGIKAKIYGIGYNMQLTPDDYGYFSAFTTTSANPKYFTTYSVIPTFTPCPGSTNTITLLNNVTNTITCGYQSDIYSDVFVLTQSQLGTGLGTTVYPRFAFYNFPYATCSSTLPINPGKFKVVLDKKLTYLGPFPPTPSPDAIVSSLAGDTLVWNIVDFYNTVNTNFVLSAIINPTNTLGAFAHHISIITPSLDVLNSNNSTVFSFNIGIPLDPNNKICYAPGIQPNGDIPFGTQELRYTVNFQNIGTAPAMNVTTLDTLDANLDWSSLEVLSSSFPVQTQVDNINGVTFFYFKGINLPDSNSNEPGSHGFVTYKINLKSGVPVNTIIKNRAHNYFDFQPPVPTNQTKNKLVQFAGISENIKENNISVYPNPADSKVSIEADLEIGQITLINNLGEIVLSQSVNGQATQLDIIRLSEGFYLMKIEFRNNQVMVKKIIKN